ncbi:thioredoxin domain-containing protein [Demequina aurantiaca]|uniref:thioredoxin domain-containing protein n=1 Tax=Demequina aurantiaca TaxID=676200 RepID=UPI0007861152|nr:thioredoxin domain-containing protein [Demequina aurantiaca]
MGICALAGAFFMPPAGIVFGHLAMQANAKGEAKNRGVSFAGLLVSYAITVLWILFFGAMFVWFPFISIPAGLMCLAGGIVGIVLGIRMQRGPNRSRWSPTESGWTIGVSSLVTFLSLALCVGSVLFFGLWASLGNEWNQSGNNTDQPYEYDDSGVFQGIAPSVADLSGGIPVGTTGIVGVDVASDAPRVDIYEDFMCPICLEFERVNGTDIDAMREAGTIQVYYHPISILDRYSQGTDYSTRAAAAATVVAELAPEYFLAFNAELYANQPLENSGGLNDDELVSLAIQAGVPAEVAVQIVDGRYAEWVAAATEQASIDGMNGTPTVILDGLVVDQREVQYFQPGELRAAFESIRASTGLA